MTIIKGRELVHAHREGRDTFLELDYTKMYAIKAT